MAHSTHNSILCFHSGFSGTLSYSFHCWFRSGLGSKSFLGLIFSSFPPKSMLGRQASLLPAAPSPTVNSFALQMLAE